jgi:hypothetical protein
MGRRYLPVVGESAELVSGFCAGNHVEVSRVFVPLEREEFEFVSWRELASSVGCEIHALSRWRDIAVRLDPSAERNLTPASGSCDQATATRLTRALCTTPPEVTEGTYALWPGYAGELDDFNVDQLFTYSDPAPLGRYGGLAIVRRPLTWLLSRTVEHWRVHAPVYVWPDDGSFLISCPIYSNSLYVSGPAGVTKALSRAGLEAFGIPRSSLLPSRDDY